MHSYYGCPGILRRLLGKDVRLLVVLRDPVLRAYSHYQMTADNKSVTNANATAADAAGKARPANPALLAVDTP